ncbi:hypothetical protein [Gordonia hydrophobica]|uniref:Uncharacterized protein n=1 Tax=Gordonia hydrophobica TaxID=40516 RepID=A0ABZ2U0D2_9ACTN|nr:hypothetical protein [Gordonia hydrophobica]MBM7367732.1 hypothetical protein [Gordonia hydrophobica]
MPLVTRRFSPRATAIGVVTGVVSFTGLSVTADNSALPIQIAGLILAGAALVTGSRRLRGADWVRSTYPDLAEGGPFFESGASPRHAAVHSVETDLHGTDRTTRFGMTVVDEQHPSSSYVTSTRTDASPELLAAAVQDRPRATVREVRGLPGAVRMTHELQQYGAKLARSIPDDIPAQQVFTVPRDGVVAPRWVTACFCVAVALSGGATAAVLPSTSAIGDVFSQVSPASDGPSDAGTGSPTPTVDSAIGRFGLDAFKGLAALAEKDAPGSTGYVLDIEFRGSTMRLDVLDRATSQRNVYRADQNDDGDFDVDEVEITLGTSSDSSARIRNSFPIATVDPAIVVQAYDEITTTAGAEQSGQDRVEITKESPDDEPLITVRIKAGDFDAKLDGTVAPIFDAEDTATLLAQTAALLPLVDVEPNESRIQSLAIGDSSTAIDLTAYPAAKRGASSHVTVSSGHFPQVTTDTDPPNYERDEFFALSQITLVRLDAIVRANAARVGAEPADTASAKFEITKRQLSGADRDSAPVLQIQVTFPTMSDSRGTYLADGTFVA